MCVGWRGQAVGVGAGQQSRIACTRLACDKADRFFLKGHPQTLALTFRDEASRPERVNAVDAFVRWHELDEAERDVVRAAVSSDVTPIDEANRLAFLSEFEGVGISSDAFFPLRRQPGSRGEVGVSLCRAAGRIGAGRRCDGRRRSLWHGDGAHGAAAVFALGNRYL